MKKTIVKNFSAFFLALFLMATFIFPSFASTATSVEEETVNGFTIQQLSDAFKNGNSETIQAYMDTFAPDESDVKHSDPSLRWESDTSGKNESEMSHSQLTAIALLQYIVDMQNLFGISNNFGYKLSEWQMILTYSEIPDKPTILAFADHFYNAETGKSWNLLSPTAKGRFEDFYNEAIYLFESNRNASLQSLGQALHFIQDVNEPHHATNKVAGLSQHSQFEKFASTRLQSVADTAGLSPNTSLYYTAQNTSSPDFLHMAAITGAQYIEIANQPKSGSNWDAVAYTTLLNSERFSSAVLYKFAKAVGMI